MSIRPNFEAIIGVDNAVKNDPRCDKKRFRQIMDGDISGPIPNNPESLEGVGWQGTKDYYAADLIFCGNPAGGMDNFLGCTIASAGEDLARFLMSYYEANGIEQERVLYLEPQSVNEWFQEQRQVRDGISFEKELPFFTPWYQRHYEDKVLYILKYAGWDIAREDLKWMLISYWA